MWVALGDAFNCKAFERWKGRLDHQEKGLIWGSSSCFYVDTMGGKDNHTFNAVGLNGDLLETSF